MYEDQYWPKYKEFLDSIIQSYVGKPFNTYTDINLENLHLLLIPILEAYKTRKFKLGKLADIGDAIEKYIYHRYKEDFPETCYPNLDPNDYRSVSLYILEQIQDFELPLLPNNMPEVIDLLSNVNCGKQVFDKTEEYFQRLDKKNQDEEAKKIGYIN